MMEPLSNKEPSQELSPEAADEQKVSSRHQRHSPLIPVIAGLVSTLFSTNNWSCIVVPVALILVLVDLIVRGARLQFRTRILLAVATGAVIGRVLSVGPDWAFNEALRIDTPPGVTDVQISRHYIGGPGEHVMIVEFLANATALINLKSRAGRSTNERNISRWREAGAHWKDALSFFVMSPMNQSAQRQWNRIRPFENVQTIDLGAQQSGDVVLFVEPETGRCAMVHVRY